MIKGLGIFKEYFRDFIDQYVLIGGTACDIVFEADNRRFRATKDIDMVLIVEAITPEFGSKFWEFIKDGGYENRCRSNGEPQFYRFDKPKSPTFPYMIELFTRSKSVFDDEASGCRKLHMGEALSSLSAILLNNDYYRLLQSGKDVVSDVPILPHLYLIVFKAKAWLNLTESKASGHRVKTTDIQKHKNDVARLAALLTGNEACEIPNSIRDDMLLFVKAFETDPPDIKSLGIAGTNSSDIVELLNKIYIK